MRAIVLSLLLLAVSFAGCSEEADPDEVTGEEVIDKEGFQFTAGTGAIAGLLVDDRFRPIDLEAGEAPGEFQSKGFILLQETGKQYLTNENGEFSILDLEPGTYTLRVSAEGHEAIPQQIRVTAGEFAELNLVARRTASDNDTILTQEYSVFIPCSVRYLDNGRVVDCTFDQSGDSFRPDFQTNYTAVADDAVAMITELRANQEGGYRVQIRLPNFDRYAALTDYQTDYIRILNVVGEVNEDANFYGNNIPFTLEKEFQTILFALGDFEEEANELGFCCGLGVKAGIRAQFVQTVFLGTAPSNLESYCVLC